MGSPKKLAASRKTAATSSGSSPRVAARASQVAASASQVAVSAGHRGMVPSRPHADSPINVDEGEPPRYGMNRRLNDAAMEVKVTPIRVPSPPKTSDSWSGVL